MGSPLGPTLANVFLCFYERKWLEKCPLEFKSVFHRRYFDDIFFLFKSTDHLEKFVTTLILVTRTCPFHLRKEKGKMSF